MIEEINLKNSESLWTEIIKYQQNSISGDEFIYRGHSDARWQLIPAVLRPKFKNSYSVHWASTEF